MFNPHLDGHRLRLEIVDHAMSHSGDFRQMQASIAALDGDFRSIGFLRYPTNFGSELLDGDVTAIIDHWLWADVGDVIRYMASQQRHIDAYCRSRLLD